MVFNGDSGNLDICTLADKMLGDSDDTEFPLSEKALYGNMALKTSLLLPLHLPLLHQATILSLAMKR